MSKRIPVVLSFFVFVFGCGPLCLGMDSIGDTLYNVTHILPTVDLLHGKIKKPKHVHDGSGARLLVEEARDAMVGEVVTGVAGAVVGRDVVRGVGRAVGVGETAARAGYVARKAGEWWNDHPYDVEHRHDADVHVPVADMQPPGGW